MVASPAALVNAVFTDLEAWAAPEGGVVSLTQNPYDLLESLCQRPSGWRLTVHWEGDDPADRALREVLVVDHRFRLILDGDLGPTMIPRIGLIRPTAARTPFLELVSAVRSRMLAYRFPWLERPNDRFRYVGTDDKVPLPDGYALAAYSLRFNLYGTMATPEHGVVLDVTE